MISAEFRSGEVGCRHTTVPLNRSRLQACRMGKIPGVVSLASFFGLRKGTETPRFFARRAISGLSVDSSMSSKSFDFCAARMVHSSRGLPSKSLMFFPGILLEPALAGMIPMIWFWLNDGLR